MFDIVIRGGEVFGGEGGIPCRADLGIRGDRIVKIGTLSSGEGRRAIDAGKLAVAPGFIDMHGHEFTALVDPRPDSKIRQGVTTEVIGNCGESFAPAYGDGKEKVRELLASYGDPRVEMCWSGVGEFLDLLTKVGAVTNQILLAGHGSIRASVLGLENRKPSPRELDEMKELLARSMEEGAWGMSTGLIYTPALYADTVELIELASVASSYGGIYTSHIRGEHEGVLEPAIEEAIRIGREAGISVEISHLKLYGTQLWGKADRILRRLGEARREGLDISADAYPYTATHTTLKTVLPPWVQEGGVSRMVERLRDPGLREKMKGEMERGEVIYFKGVGWDGVVLVHSRKDPWITGRSIDEIARARGKDPFLTVFDIIADEPEMRANYFALDERDVQTILKSPLVMIGSDSYGLTADGASARGKPHPRAFGCFPRVLGKYAREEGLFPVAEGIRKMTSFPAAKLGLKDRGTIREGAHADVVVFDPVRTIDKATFREPCRYPDGIEYVLLNGRVVVEHGEHSGELAGRVLRRPSAGGSPS
jgi:N-acyl-D-amino-acid deacylase